LYLSIFGYRTNGTFVEVGAYNGITFSNTYGLALADWHGLLFEPVPELYKQCVINYCNLPNISIKQCCIGDVDGKVTLYLGDYLSTTNIDRVKIYSQLSWSSGWHVGQIEVPIFTLNTVLAQQLWPVSFDLLVVDVEGTELEVLKSFNLSYWCPHMVIVEACEMHPDHRLSNQASEINKIFLDAHYKKIYCDTVNTIFISS
jgi:FkbM family methyltransferase